MGALREYFAAIGRTVATIGDGLAVTGSYFLRKPVTLQYPDRTPQPLQATLPERSRGLLEVDLEACTGCGLCEKTCPLMCISIEVAKGKERLIQRFDIDLARCMHCGLCAECCPTECLHHTREFEGGMYSIDTLYMRYVEKALPVAKVSKDKPLEKAPSGSILRRLLPDAWGRRNRKQLAASAEYVAKLDAAAAERAKAAAAAATAAAAKAPAADAAAKPAAAKPAGTEPVVGKPAGGGTDKTVAAAPTTAAAKSSAPAPTAEAVLGATGTGGKGEA